MLTLVRHLYPFKFKKSSWYQSSVRCDDKANLIRLVSKLPKSLSSAVDALVARAFKEQHLR